LNKLTVIAAIAVHEVRAKVAWGQRVEQSIRRSSSIDSNDLPQVRGKMAHEASDEALSSLHDSCVQVGPDDELVAVGVQIGVSIHGSQSSGHE